MKLSSLLSAVVLSGTLAQSASAAGQNRYTVRPGESLSQIAERVYGEAFLWPIILEANLEALDSDADKVSEGMVLTVPDLSDSGLPGLAAPAAPASKKAKAAATRAPVQTPSLTLASGPGAWIYNEGIARTVRREFLTFEAAGRIAYVDPNLKEGDSVREGQVIAYQDQRRPGAGLATAQARINQARAAFAVQQATVAEARANLELAQKTFQRFSVLLQQNSASRQEFDQARAQLESARATAQRAARQQDAARADIAVAEATRSSAQVARDESVLRAPITGIIARLNIERGDFYTPDVLQSQTEQEILSSIPVILLDPSQFEIEVNVPQTLLNALTVGAPVLIDLIDPGASLEERTPDEEEGPLKPASAYAIAGTIYSISPLFDSDRQNFQIKVRTTRGEVRLRDGSTVSLWIRKTEG